MNYIRNNIKVSLGIAITTAFLSACGGNKNDDTPPIKETSKDSQIIYSQLTGTAFSAFPLASGSVTAICKDGSGFKAEVTTDNQGKWKGDVNSTQFPCRLEVTSSQEKYHGYAAKAGNVNLNLLSDLIIANATSQSPSIWYKTGGNIDESRLKASNQALIKELKNKGYSIDESTDLISTVSDLNSSEYQVIKDLIISIKASQNIKDIDALLSLIKDGNISQIPPKKSVSDVLPKLEINSNACIKRDEVNYNHCNSTFINDFTENQLITAMGDSCTLTKVDDKIILSNGKITLSAYLNGEERDFAVIPSNDIPGDSVLLYAGNSDGKGVNFGYSISRKQIMIAGAGSQDENDPNSLVCSTTRK